MFLGRQPDEVVREHLSQCQALIFPGEEDFGITPVEAQAAGRPVIAYRGGGALETIVSLCSEGGIREGTGVFFYPKTAEALAQTVKSFDASRFDSHTIQQHAKQFDIAVFRRKIKHVIDQQYAKRKFENLSLREKGDYQCNRMKKERC